MSQHWATMKEAGALSGLRFMVFVYSVLGRVAFSIVLAPVMVYFFVRRGGARRASVNFLRRVKHCYPERLQGHSLTWLSFRHFLNYGESLLDKVIVRAQATTEIVMDTEEEKKLTSLISSHQGGLFIGSHFGNLEYAYGLAARHPKLVINVLMYNQHARNFTSLIKGAGSDAVEILIQVTDIDFELALTLREKVKRGEWVLITGDRVPLGDSSRVCSATFFGEKANFPIGPYVLANLLRCPVYLLHCFRVENHYEVGVELFEEEFQTLRKTRQQAYERAAQKFADSLEKQVARMPLQWFNFFDFWGDQKQQQVKHDMQGQT